MTRTCPYCGETSPSTLASCPSCGRSDASGQFEHVMTPPRGVDARGDGQEATEGLYTQLAMRAVDLSDTFNAVFSEPMPGWRIEMGRPGMSTAGGKQALQHIGLRGADGGTLVVGSVDATASQVELRSWRRVDGMFRERHGRPLPIRSADWERFSERVAEFFREEGLTVRIETRPPARRAADDEDAALAPHGVPLAWVLVAVVLVAVLAGAITWFVLTRPVAPAPAPWPGPAVVPPTSWPAPAPPGAP